MKSWLFEKINNIVRFHTGLIKGGKKIHISIDHKGLCKDSSIFHVHSGGEKVLDPSTEWVVLLT